MSILYRDMNFFPFNFLLLLFWQTVYDIHVTASLRKLDDRLNASNQTCPSFLDTLVCGNQAQIFWTHRTLPLLRFNGLKSRKCQISRHSFPRSRHHKLNAKTLSSQNNVSLLLVGLQKSITYQWNQQKASKQNMYLLKCCNNPKLLRHCLSRSQQTTACLQMCVERDPK